MSAYFLFCIVTIVTTVQYYVKVSMKGLKWCNIMSPPRSKVWKHFIKVDSETASCKICFKHLKTSGNTSNLAKHMKLHSQMDDKANNKALKAKAATTATETATGNQKTLVPFASLSGTTSASTSLTSTSTCTM